MSRSISGKVKINSYADIISGDDTKVTEVPLADLYPFKDHPFRVLDDSKMKETVDSIKRYGVLTPGIVRPRIEGGYEIIAGHRRKRACELAGLETMPVLIRNYSDDESVIVMVDSNIQREDLLPSEKAHAYRMRYEAMKHQGSAGGDTLSSIGELAGESGKTVQRYIRLSYLREDLLKQVDEGRLSVRSGVELSYLSMKEQNWVSEKVKEAGDRLSPAKAEKIRWYSQSKELTKAIIDRILDSKRARVRDFIIKADRLADYFPAEMTDDEIEEIVYSLLRDWLQNRQ
ncbi:MAG: ParB/RepB/Spo0J family partition protein [Lachnospiraceae bacterium]|nr:ParB/RepB/Spo0J family partition protein [Lachnospiraceae bacterium]